MDYILCKRCCCSINQNPAGVTPPGSKCFVAAVGFQLAPIVAASWAEGLNQQLLAQPLYAQRAVQSGFRTSAFQVLPLEPAAYAWLPTAVRIFFQRPEGKYSCLNLGLGSAPVLRVNLQLVQKLLLICRKSQEKTPPVSPPRGGRSS